MKNQTKPNKAFTSSILTIAGSDPTGGAGIQADLKTFTVLHAYGAAAITNLTVQNTRGVTSCHPVDPDVVYRQIIAVLEDLEVSHIKIGMVGTPEVAEIVGKAITDFSGEIIYDPVLCATAGQPLLTPGSIDSIRHLITKVTVITPNNDELQTITGLSCDSTDKSLTAATTLFSSFNNLRAVVLKGGHMGNNPHHITDYLLLPAGSPAPTIHQATHPRISSPNTHGTGCTFAAAFTAYHLHTKHYKQAFHSSVNFLDHLLKAGSLLTIGHGNGGLTHHLFLP